MRVWRGAEAGEFVAYDVPRQASQTVLDVVTHIQRNIDPTLSYRFACRVGMCGSCAMNVNGKARWTCRTHVADVAVDDALEIAPLRNLPMVKDLVTDMAPFFDKMARAKSNFKGAATRADEFARVMPDSPQRKRSRCRNRVHRLRRVLQRVRRRHVESRLSGAGRAQSRVDAGQRCARRAQSGTSRAQSPATRAVTPVIRR